MTDADSAKVCAERVTRDLRAEVERLRPVELPDGFDENDPSGWEGFVACPVTLWVGATVSGWPVSGRVIGFTAGRSDVHFPGRACVVVLVHRSEEPPYTALERLDADWPMTFCGTRDEAWTFAQRHAASYLQKSSDSVATWTTKPE